MFLKIYCLVIKLIVVGIKKLVDTIRIESLDEENLIDTPSTLSLSFDVEEAKEGKTINILAPTRLLIRLINTGN